MPAVISLRTSGGLASAGFTQGLAPVSGQYYGATESTPAGILSVENRLYFTPIWLPALTTIDRLGYTISVAAGDVQYQTKLGLYADLNGRPGALLVDAGFDPVGVATGARTLTIAQIRSGWVWSCIIGNRNAGATGTQATIRGYGTNSAFGRVFGHATPDTNNVVTSLHNDQTIGTWATYNLPGTAPALTPSTGVGAVVLVRAA